MKKLIHWFGVVLFSAFLAAVASGVSLPVYAQSADSSLNGPINDTHTGPHEAGNIPNISDKVSGLPMVVIVRAGSSAEQIGSVIVRYSSARPLVLRVTEVTDQTTPEDAATIANKLNSLAGSVPAGTIVVYGNELNNLQHEWKNTGTTLAAAGAKYATLFTVFQNTLDRNHYQTAAAPLDLNNGDYNWEEFYNAAASAYNSADKVVANAYEIPRIGRTAAQAVQTVESKAGRSVDFLTEFGYDPEGTLEENVRFLRQNDPPKGLFAATLVPNKCNDQAFNTAGTTADPWLYYVKGEVYKQSGEKVTIGSGNECGGSTSFTLLDPVLVYPRLEKDSSLIQIAQDQTLEDTMWRRYLANTQVYCAPDQVFYPTQSGQGNLPNCTEATDQGLAVTNLGDGVCSATEYPVIDVQSELNISRLSFPLFRDEAGGISIEADLSRVQSNDTFFEAAKRNSKPEYAPQFFLTSPQTQCLNAVRYAEYVDGLCENWSEESASGDEEDRCGANIDVQLPDGSNVPILDLKEEFLPSESVCVNYTKEVDDPDSRLAQAIRSIQPHTPRVFKMGFLVHHTFNYDANLPLSRQVSGDPSVAQKIVNWFQGIIGNSVSLYEAQPGEKIDIVPVWYHVGMAASMYDSFQTTRPYAINPDNVKDTEFTADGTQPFVGPLLQTYLPVLQPEHQDFIGDTIRNYVYGTNDLMKYMAQHFQSTGSRRPPSQQNVYFQNSDVAEVTGLPLGWTPNAYDAAVRTESDKYHQYPLPCLDGQACFCFDTGSGEQCFNQSYDEVKEGFPENFEPTESYLDAMRRQIIYRINSGVQATHRYPQNIIDETRDVSWVDGSISMRHFGAIQDLCDIDQDNVRQGYQEDVSQIQSDAHQAKPSFIAEIITQIRSKVLGSGGRDTLERGAIYPGGPSTADMLKERVERTYLILPDDAIKIGVVQNTLLQAFLSPETYVSLIQGEHPLLPIREQYEAQGIELNGAISVLSAHLRVGGVTRSVQAQADGYVQVAPLYYENLGDSCGSTVVIDGSGVSGLPWVPKDPDPTISPTPDNNCLEIKVVQKSEVGVRGSIPGENPDESPEAPGQPCALLEFVRRMAFTPLHMQDYEEYPGLEKFYGGGSSGPLGKDASDRLSHTTPAACAYQPREIDVAREFGYSSDLTNPSLDPFRAEICNVAERTGVPGEYLRALLNIEASPFLRAVRGEGRGEYNPAPTTFICGANSYGAVGIMSIIIGECSSEPVTQGFSNAENSLDPDLCTMTGAMTAASNLILQHISILGEPPASANYAYYELLAERYLGVGGCGVIGVRSDGALAYPGGPDYCAYVAEKATGQFRNYCDL